MKDSLTAGLLVQETSQHPFPVQRKTPEVGSNVFQYIKTRHSSQSPVVKPGALPRVLYLYPTTILGGDLSWQHRENGVPLM